MEFYSAIKKNEICQKKWIDLKVILSQVTQSQKDKSEFLCLMGGF